MIPFRNLALALALGFAATSSIITNRAFAEDAAPAPAESPFRLTGVQASAELLATRDSLATALQNLDAGFNSEEAALELIKSAWGREHHADSLPQEAGAAARELVELWKERDVRASRDASLAGPVTVLDAALAAGAVPTPGQIASLRLESPEFSRRLESIRAGMVRHAMIVLEEAQALVQLDVQGRVVTEEERAAVKKRFATRREGNREALGTARFGPMFDALSAEGTKRVSTQLEPMGEEPSGTRMEVLYWRLGERTAQLRGMAARREELEKQLKHEHDRLSPVGPGDMFPEEGAARPVVWAALDELRALDRRQSLTALAVAQLRLDLWTEVEEKAGAPSGDSAERMARRRGLLETGRDRMLAFASQGREPGRPRVELDEAAMKALGEETGARVRAALLRVTRALVDLGEVDGTLEGISRRAQTGAALDAALQGYAAEGVSEVLGPAAVAIADAYAGAAFAPQAGNETFLEKPVAAEVLAKAGDDKQPAKHFWSTQELRAEFAKSGIKPADIDTMAARLQAERLLAVLGSPVK